MKALLHAIQGLASFSSTVAKVDRSFCRLGWDVLHRREERNGEGDLVRDKSSCFLFLLRCLFPFQSLFVACDEWILASKGGRDWVLNAVYLLGKCMCMCMGGFLSRATS